MIELVEEMNRNREMLEKRTHKKKKIQQQY